MVVFWFVRETGSCNTYEAFRPTGETLIIPFRYSMKVPLRRAIRVSYATPRDSKAIDSPLDRSIQISNVVQDELDHPLVILLPDVLNETSAGQLFPHLVSGQTVLGEPVVEILDGGDTIVSELFVDLDEIGSSDKGDDAFFTEVLEELDHLGLGGLVIVGRISTACTNVRVDLRKTYLPGQTQSTIYIAAITMVMSGQALLFEEKRTGLTTCR